MVFYKLILIHEQVYMPCKILPCIIKLSFLDLLLIFYLPFSYVIVLLYLVVYFEILKLALSSFPTTHIHVLPVFNVISFPFLSRYFVLPVIFYLLNHVIFSGLPFVINQPLPLPVRVISKLLLSGYNV